MKIAAVRVTPVALKDPPLLNAGGVHQPYALRVVTELVTDEGYVGLGETHGNLAILETLMAARDVLIGLDPFDTNELFRRVAPGMAAGCEQGATAAQARAVSGLEVACLDLQGQALNRPIVDLLGGAVRARVPYSAYLFYKYAEHHDSPYPTDTWGAALTPEEVVAQAQRMTDEYGFGSIKLKGGVFEPDLEVETIKQLREAFPNYPLRLDPNAVWAVETSIRVAKELAGTLEYLEDPTPGLEGMAAVAKEAEMPLATNMVVTSFDHFPEAAERKSVRIVLADHHYWGGLRATQELARLCATWGWGLSMHSNSHLGISLAAMTHVAASLPHLTYACDTHYPWQKEDVIQGGRIPFDEGCVAVPSGPGLGVQLDQDALSKLHEQYLECGVRERDDYTEMLKHDPVWSNERPRF